MSFYIVQIIEADTDIVVATVIWCRYDLDYGFYCQENLTPNAFRVPLNLFGDHSMLLLTVLLLLF